MTKAKANEAAAAESDAAEEAKAPRQTQSVISSAADLRDAELEELGVDLIEADAAQATAKEKRKAAYQALKAAMIEKKISEYPMIDRPKTLVAKGRDIEVVVKDRDVEPPR